MNPGINECLVSKVAAMLSRKKVQSTTFDSFSHRRIIDSTKIATWSIFAILVLDMLNQLVGYFTGIKLLAPIILLASWPLLAILLYWLFSLPGRHYLFKIFIVLTFVKWVVYIFLYGHLHFQKELLTLPLLMIALAERENFRAYCQKNLGLFKYVLCTLFALTVVPFIGRYSVNTELYRFSAVWPWPQSLGYYCVAFMLLFLHKNIAINMLIYVMILYTGAKSAILAGTIVLMYSMRVHFILKAVRTRRKFLVAIATACISLVTFTALGGIDHFTGSLTHHYEKLFSVEVTSDAFGTGRVQLNRLALDELKNFGDIDLLLGKSATSLYDLYAGRETGGWPHNDFLTALLIYGILGLIFYIYYMLVFPLKFTLRDYPWKNIALVTSIFVLMATNGFYMYRASFLFLLCYFDIYEKGRLSNNTNKM